MKGLLWICLYFVSGATIYFSSSSEPAKQVATAPIHRSIGCVPPATGPMVCTCGANCPCTSDCWCQGTHTDGSTSGGVTTGTTGIPTTTGTTDGTLPTTTGAPTTTGSTTATTTGSTNATTTGTTNATTTGSTTSVTTGSTGETTGSVGTTGTDGTIGPPGTTGSTGTTEGTTGSSIGLDIRSVEFTWANTTSTPPIYDESASFGTEGSAYPWAGWHAAGHPNGAGIYPALTATNGYDVCKVQVRTTGAPASFWYYILVATQRHTGRHWATGTGTFTSTWAEVQMASDDKVPAVGKTQFGMDFTLIGFVPFGPPVPVASFTGMPDAGDTYYVLVQKPIQHTNSLPTIKRLEWLTNAALGKSSFDNVAAAIQDAIANCDLAHGNGPMVAQGHEWRMMPDGAANKGQCDEQARLMEMALSVLGVPAEGNHTIRASGYKILSDDALARSQPASMTASVEDSDYITVQDRNADGNTVPRKAYLVMDFSNAGNIFGNDVDQYNAHIDNFNFQRWEGVCFVDNKWRSLWPENTANSAFEFYHSGAWPGVGGFAFRQLFVFTDDDMPPDDKHNNIVVRIVTPYMPYQTVSN